MNPIAGCKQIPCLRSKEGISALVGGVAFTIATIALCYFLLTTQNTLTMTHLVSFSAIGGVAVAGLITFVLGIYFYDRKQKKVLDAADTREPTQTIHQKKKTPIHSVSTPYTENIRSSLPALFNSLEMLLTAYVKCYCKFQNTTHHNSDHISSSLELIHEQLDGFLQNPQEILQSALTFNACNLEPQAGMSALLKQSNAQIIKGLADQLILISLEKQILQAITSQADLTDKTLNKYIQNLKNSYKTDNYAIALSNLINHLYINAEVPQKLVDEWTVHIMPAFLDSWRELFFDSIVYSIEMFKRGFSPQGAFNNWTKKTAMKGFLILPGKSLLADKFMKRFIRNLPLVPQRQQALSKAALTLFEVFSTPYYYGTFEKGNFSENVKNITFSFDIPQVTGKSWKECIETYTTYFTALTQAFTNARPP